VRVSQRGGRDESSGNLALARKRVKQRQGAGFEQRADSEPARKGGSFDVASVLRQTGGKVGSKEAVYAIGNICRSHLGHQPARKTRLRRV